MKITIDTAEYANSVVKTPEELATEICEAFGFEFFGHPAVGTKFLVVVDGKRCMLDVKGERIEYPDGVSKHVLDGTCYSNMCEFLDAVYYVWGVDDHGHDVLYYEI